MVGMRPGDDGDLLAPQPKLADLPTLAIQVRAAGLPVEIDIEGETKELPAGIELAAYRIIQEALTNAIKHADGATATVHVCYRVHALELEITDTGTHAPGPASGRSRARRHAREGRSLRRPIRRHTRRPGGRLRHPGAVTGPMTTVLIADDQALVR